MVTSTRFVNVLNTISILILNVYLMEYAFYN